jgi:hypothetical protein
MLYKVERPIDGPDGEIAVGTVLDASEWAHRRLFEQQGRLRPLNEQELAAHRLQSRGKLRSVKEDDR